LQKLYLDTSAILKRYLTEDGTKVIDALFDKAEAGELVLTFSLWNIGEILGVLDEKRRRGWLDEEECRDAVEGFTKELFTLLRLETLKVSPILARIVAETWDIILEHHIYEADALQITACINTKSDALVSGDKKLVETCRKRGLEAFDVAREEQEILKFLL
jgi:uncharacterized protein